MKIEDIEDNMEIQDDKSVQLLGKELDPDAIIIQLGFGLLNELFIYPAIICSLYGLINEKQWKFDDALAGYSIVYKTQVYLGSAKTYCISIL